MYIHMYICIHIHVCVMSLWFVCMFLIQRPHFQSALLSFLLQAMASFELRGGRGKRQAMEVMWAVAFSLCRVPNNYYKIPEATWFTYQRSFSSTQFCPDGKGASPGMRWCHERLHSGFDIPVQRGDSSHTYFGFVGAVSRQIIWLCSFSYIHLSNNHFAGFELDVMPGQNGCPCQYCRVNCPGLCHYILL